MAFICHYAPTMATSYLELKEHGNMVSIDEHYRQLSQALQDIPKEFDRVYLGGDANGRIGRVDREVWDAELGAHITDTHHNGNGIAMLEFCKKEQLVIANSVFSQKVHGSATYRAPGESEYTRTLDYIMTPARHLGELVACHVLGGVHFDETDHRLVVADFRISMDHQRRGVGVIRVKGVRKVRPDYIVLKTDDVREQFNEYLQSEMDIQGLEERCRVQPLVENREINADGRDDVESVALTDNNIVDTLYQDCLNCIKVATAAVVPNQRRCRISEDNWFAKHRVDLLPLIERKKQHSMHCKRIGIYLYKLVYVKGKLIELLLKLLKMRARNIERNIMLTWFVNSRGCLI